MPNKGKKKCLTCGKLVNPRGMHSHARSHVAQQETVGFVDADYESIPLSLNPDTEQKERQTEAIEHALRQQLERTSAENGSLRERVERQEKIIAHMSGLILALLDHDE